MTLKRLHNYLAEYTKYCMMMMMMTMRAFDCRRSTTIMSLVLVAYILYAGIPIHMQVHAHTHVDTGPVANLPEPTETMHILNTATICPGFQQNVTSDCILNNSTTSFDTSTTLTFQGSLTLVRSSITMNRDKCQGLLSTPNCVLTINVPHGDLILSDTSLLLTPDLQLFVGGDILVDGTSHISGDGQGWTGQSQGKATLGSGGGGNGGGGAGVCGKSKLPGINYIRGDNTYSAPWWYGGAGVEGAFLPVTPGGGRLNITAIGHCSINGTISANGASGVSTTKGIGGGAGGVIIIHCHKSMSGSEADAALLSAEGGTGSVGTAASGGGGGGSGGFIIIDVPQASPARILPTSVTFATGGGASPNTVQTKQACFIGASGITYFRRQRFLVVANRYNIESPFVPGVTPASIEKLPTDLTNFEIVTANIQLESKSGIFKLSIAEDLKLTHASIGCAQIAHTKHAQISSTTGTLVSSDISCPSLTLDSIGAFSMDSSSTIEFRQRLNITSRSGSVSIKGSVSDALNNEADIVTELHIDGQYVSMTSGSSLKSDFVFLNSQGTMSLVGSVSGTYEPSNCTSFVPTFNPCRDESRSSASSFFVLASAQTFVLNSPASLTGRRILVCASNSAVIAGSTTATGCAAQKGKAPGATIRELPGGGGGHASVGGNGVVGSSIAPGGATYDLKTSIPGMSGSGGGQTGGSGGGVARFESPTIILNAATIVASGSAGQSGGAASSSGGGGAGGVIAFVVSNNISATTSTVIDVSGGDGGSPGGGGGSGGFVVLDTTDVSMWKQLSPISRIYGALAGNNATSAFFAAVHSSGGNGISPGTAGGDGIARRLPLCGAGQDGLLCAPCAPGTSKAHGGDAACVPCAPGMFATDPGSLNCSACSPGTFASGGSLGCATCPSGSSSSFKAAECTVCKAGEFSNALSKHLCTPCPVNMYSKKNASVCTFCQQGFFSDRGAISCKRCSNAPDNSQYLADQGCAFECDAGFVYPKCVPPFINLIQHLGAIGLTLLVIGITLVLAVPFFYCWLRKRRALKQVASMDEMEQQHEESRSRTHSGASASSHYRTLLSPSKSGGRFVPNNAGTEIELTRHSLALTDDDVDNFLFRIYLEGTNSFSEPLRLPMELPHFMSDIVIPEEYATYAHQCYRIAEWSTWEKVVYGILLVCYYPLAKYFHAARRKTRMQDIQAFHAEYDHSFLRDYRARALYNTLKFSYSRCCTLAWLDVLDSTGMHPSASTSTPANNRSDNSPVPTALSEPRPALPLVLLCGGDGAYLSPFHLDITDGLLKSMVKYYGPGWFSFVAHLNVHLRVIHPTDSTTLKSAIQYLRIMRRMGIGIGPMMPLGGLAIELGYVPHGDDASAQSWRPALIITYANEEDAYASSRGSSVMGTSENSPEIRMRRVHDHKMPETRAPDLLANSSLAYAAIGSPEEYARHRPHKQAATRGDDAFGMRQYAAGDDDDGETPLLHSQQSTVSYNATDSHLEYGVLLLKDIVDVDALSRPAQDVSVIDKLRHYLLRVTLANVVTRFAQWQAALLLGLMLTASLTLTFAMAAVFLQIVPTDYMLILLIFPLADIVSPLLGLSGLSFSSVILTRMFSNVNTLSVCNAVIAVISAARHVDKIGALGLSLSIAMIVTKLILAVLGNLYVAHLEFSKDLRQSRRDYLKRKAEMPQSHSALTSPRGDHSGGYSPPTSESDSVHRHADDVNGYGSDDELYRSATSASAGVSITNHHEDHGLAYQEEDDAFESHSHSHGHKLNGAGGSGSAPSDSDYVAFAGHSP
jgi:hypothetical protein